MTVTYLAHSGFLVEWDGFYTLFDFWKGELPALKAEKPLLVFASHSHDDHYNPVIFQLVHPDTRYFLSSDIRLPARWWDELGMTREVFARVTSLRPGSVLSTEAGGGPLTIRTVPSTDQGVAFLLCAEGRLVYHAGDLNWWHWEEEGALFCANMEKNYRRAIAMLASYVRDEAADSGCAPELDAAMAPMDPRLGDACALGVEHLLRTVRVKKLFPMHLWDAYDTIARYRRAHPEDADRVVPITREGESFPL